MYILLGLAAMVTVGLSLLMGYAGQVSLGQGVLLRYRRLHRGPARAHGVPALAGLIAAPVAAAVFAALVGVPLLRLRGHQLAFATLAMQLILLSLAGQLDWTGGDIGLQGIPQLGDRPVEVASAIRATPTSTWAALALVMLVTRNVIASRPGRGLRALATSETAAASRGIPVGRYKLLCSACRPRSPGWPAASSLLHRLPGARFVPGAAFVRVRRDGRGRRAGTIWGALVGATAITLLVQVLNHGRHAARDAQLRAQRAVLRGLRAAARRGRALPAAGPRAGTERTAAAPPAGTARARRRARRGPQA